MSVNTRCDCVVVLDKATMVLKCLSKCRFHVQELLREMRSEEEHYASLGALDHPEVYIQEFEECFGQLPKGQNPALEIGAGTSPYIRMFQDAGYAYTAIESSPFAAKWLRNAVGDMAVTEGDWEKLPSQNRYSVIFAPHVIEHMNHAPSAIKKMAGDLIPGGLLYIIVPNDEDLCNPDHWWFFNTESLRVTVEAAGLRVDIMTSRRRVKHEEFIYCKAVKPPSPR